MTTDRYRELPVHAFSASDNTWLNLGYWHGAHPERVLNAADYAEACESLALVAFRPVRAALSRWRERSGRAAIRVFDFGCGHGDSLLLWERALRDAIPLASGAAHIVGVNYSLTETAACSRKIERQRQSSGERQLSVEIEAICADAVTYRPTHLASSTNTPPALEVIACLSVDAAYHFHTRRAWFHTCATILSSFFPSSHNCVKVVSATDICMSESWSTEPWSLLARPWKYFLLRAISITAGVPMENIMVGPAGVRLQLMRAMSAGATTTSSLTATASSTEITVITEDVLPPFCRYAFAESRRAPLFSAKRWILLLSGAYMRALYATGAVDVVTYSYLADASLRVVQ